MKIGVHKNIVLAIVAVAQFMVVLDTSIVNVALPAIYKGLGFTSDSNLQWVITAYTLAFGGFLLLGGRAADLYGRKRIFVASVSFFALASLACGLAQNSLMIEITRAVQGLAAAFMSPAALSIVLTTFKEGRERAMALSVWGAVAAGGAATGVLLGGILTEYLDWRWNFFINLPVGIAVAVLAKYYVPESRADLDHNQLDLPGAVLVTAGLMLMVFGFTKAPDWGWTTGSTLLVFGASALLLILFVINEALSKHALMPLGIFRVGNVAAANITQLPVMAGMFSMFFFITLYVQVVLGFSPVKAGLSFLPITLIIALVSITLPHILNKVSYKVPLMVAPLLMSLGLFYLSGIRVSGSYWVDVFPGLAVMALGMGMVFISITIAATNGIEAKLSGLASGLLNTSQQIGGSLGLAVLTGVSVSATKSFLVDNAHQATLPLVQIEAQVQGFKHALFVGACFTLSAFVIAVYSIKVNSSSS